MQTAEKRRTLHEILAEVSENDQYAEFFGSFKPESERAMVELAEKIEASYHKIDEWEDAAARWHGSASRYQTLADSAKDTGDALLNRAKRLKAYMAFELRSNGFEKMPGVSVSAVVKRASNPRTIIGRGATPMDLKKFPDMVEQIPRSYSFDTKSVCATLKAIDKKLAADPKAELSDMEKELLTFARLEYSYSLQFAPREVSK